MTDKINYHGEPETFERKIQKACEKALKNGVANENDITLILSFADEAFACGKISLSRRTKYVYLLLSNLEFFDTDYASANLQEIYNVSRKIRNAKKSNGEPLYKQNTIHDHIWILRYFALWVYDSGYSTAIPEINRKKLIEIKVPSAKRDNVRPEDIPTDEECKLILQHSTSARNRCMFSFMMDGGFRSIEVAGLKFYQIRSSRYGLTVTLNSDETKTGKQRIVPLYESSDYFSEYVSQRGAHGPNDYVFVDSNGLPLKYSAVNSALKKTVRRAGITRRIHLHLFRHRYVTTNMENGMQESAISLVVWGHPHSSCMATYAHYRSDELEDEGARARGIKVISKRKKRESSALSSKQCPFCGTMNEPHRVICKVCNKPLTTEAIETLDELKSQLLDVMAHNPLLWQAVMNAYGHQNPSENR